MPARIKLSILKKIQRKVVLLVKKIKTKIKGKFLKLKSHLDKKKRLNLVNGPSKIKGWILWILEAVIPGVGINYMMWQLADFKFSIGTIFAWAIVYYFISAEVPQFFKECRGTKK